jgi:hypothetical protein
MTYRGERNLRIKILAVTAVLVSSSFGALAARAAGSNYAGDLVQAKADYNQTKVDRKLYVSPAPKEFKPLGKGPIMELKLSLESKKISREAPIRYRLEITNMGSDPLVFGELTQSFFKTGRLPSDRITMSIKDPSGHTGSILSPFVKQSDSVREIQLPSGLTDGERAKMIASMKRKSASASTLIQTLAPGETLHTRGDEGTDGFRTLNTTYRFRALGTYELHVAFDELVKTERDSNHVRIEITP